MPEQKKEQGALQTAVCKVLGNPKDLKDRSIFRRLSLIPLLAWIGLGADGLSSSSYGPAEAFAALGDHAYLALLLALATAFTIVVISYAYSRIIEHFPHGGGGYIVATHTISKGAGVVSGSALIVDYMLTIAVSLASCGDAIFSFLPPAYHPLKIPFVISLTMVLVVLNLRGVKESVMVLAPIFIVFVATHAMLLGYGISIHGGRLPSITQQFTAHFASDLRTIGGLGILAIFLRSFSLGGGTYTGLEAVSNGMQILRAPKVESGKRTMLYMAVSLAATAGGLFICYLLFAVKPEPGKTLNAVLAGRVFDSWPGGYWVALVTILSEGALLLVGAQAGFTDGPRVIANMAVDSWFPRRFAALSERLTMQNGILLMGAATLALLAYSGGSVSTLIVMYSINVFLTFSLSQFGMARFFYRRRRREAKWKRPIAIHVAGFILCSTILIVTVYEKFTEGGWLTILITWIAVMFCRLIRRHYLRIQGLLPRPEDVLAEIPAAGTYNDKPLDPHAITAILLVSSYNGFGLNLFLSILRDFPGVYKNLIFVSIAEIDSGSFKGIARMEALKKSVRRDLRKYVALARRHGFAAGYRMDVAADIPAAAADLCMATTREFPRSTVFAGILVFRQERFFSRLLHNETATAIQRRLQWENITAVILPIRVDL